MNGCNPGVHAHIVHQAILNRALAKAPEDRYNRIEELRDDLRKVLREIDPEASQSISYSDNVPPRMPRSLRVASVLPQLLRKRAPTFLIAGALILALASAGVFRYLNRGSFCHRLYKFATESYY